MTDDSSGGVGLILTLLAIAAVAHFLGYTDVAQLAFWAAVLILLVGVALVGLFVVAVVVWAIYALWPRRV